MAKKFEVEGLTVKQILAMDPDKLSSLNSREMSRALRTVALAANKRVNRLREQAKKGPTGAYISKKSAAHNVALDALNAVTKDGSVRGNVFGVGKAQGDRNKMYKQLAEIRQFMGAKTSTIKGAKEVRQARERRLLGYTSEEAMKKQRTKKGKAAVEAKIRQTMSDTYAAFRKYLEYKGLPNNNYVRFEGSMSVLELLRTGVQNDLEPEQALQQAIERDRQGYEASKAPDARTNTFSLLG